MDKKYVVERMKGETREWWDGQDWTSTDTDAEWMTEKEARHVAEIIDGSATWFE